MRYYIQFLVALIFFQYFISCNTKENQKVKLELVVEEKLTAEKVTEVEAALQAQLDEQKTPTKASGTPWN